MKTVIFVERPRKNRTRNDNVEDAENALATYHAGVSWKSLKNRQLQCRALAEPSGITDIRFRKQDLRSRGGRNEHK